MKPWNTVAVIFLAMSALIVTAHAQSPREQLNQLVTQLQANPGDTALRERIIKLAQEIKPPPAVPEEARQKFVEGTAIAKSANNASGQELAVQRFQDALKIAPWWADAYYNLAVAQDLTGQFDAAQASLKLYIVTNPGEKESRDAQDRIYALNAKKDLAKVEAANTAAQATVKEQTGRAALVQSMNGAVFNHRLDSGGHVLRDYTLRIFGDGATVTMMYPFSRDPTETHSCTLVNLKCELVRNTVAYAILDVNQAEAVVNVYWLNGNFADAWRFSRQR
jgi:tetratricopeptide (TPR) repeat protein